MSTTSSTDDIELGRLEAPPGRIEFEARRLWLTVSWLSVSALYMLLIALTISLPTETAALETRWFALVGVGVLLWAGLTAISLGHGLLLRRAKNTYLSAAQPAFREWLLSELGHLFKQGLLALALLCLSYLLWCAPPDLYVFALILAILILLCARHSGRSGSKYEQREALEDPELLAELNGLMEATGIHVSELCVIKSGSKKLPPSAALLNASLKERVLDELVGNSDGADGAAERQEVYRIVFTDTMLSTFRRDEIAAVLLHELGHKYFRHFDNGAALTALIGLVLIIAGALAGMALAGISLSVASGSLQPVPFCALGIAAALAMTKLLENAISISQEYQADRYAAKFMGDAGPLIRTLTRACLSIDAEQNPNRTFWYTMILCDHPPIQKRIDRLRSMQFRTGPLTARGAAAS